MFDLGDKVTGNVTLFFRTFQKTESDNIFAALYFHKFQAIPNLWWFPGDLLVH